ncbi:rasGEF domain-containing protein [Naegleria gruberi]|uniref:RasGEF domain-containing protein n=1 Tax=Naegleria gruberi TaxID=5762 RepID=D2V9U1_NAEGR|nr:rasGEF domain-containing protein [Naegleria gruberi]EFC46306.1 rasGEF domain-containing protein [Naegleria gruberi]|eukprot:XP_002679050.1 rasGEF domain-containing protein [Naegleria gruberi strain NEG-M]
MSSSSPPPSLNHHQNVEEEIIIRNNPQQEEQQQPLHQHTAAEEQSLCNLNNNNSTTISSSLPSTTTSNNNNNNIDIDSNNSTANIVSTSQTSSSSSSNNVQINNNLESSSLQQQQQSNIDNNNTITTTTSQIEGTSIELQQQEEEEITSTNNINNNDITTTNTTTTTITNNDEEEKEEQVISNPFHLVKDCNELPINERYHSDLRPFLERLEEQPNRFKSIDQETVNMILGDWMVLTMDHLSNYKQVAPPYLYCKQINNQYQQQSSSSLYENELERHLLMIGNPNRLAMGQLQPQQQPTITIGNNNHSNNNIATNASGVGVGGSITTQQQHLTSPSTTANNLNVLSSNELTYSEDIEDDDEIEELEKTATLSNRKQNQNLLKVAPNSQSDLSNEHFNTQLSKKNVSQGSFNSNLSASYNKFSLSDQAINLNNSEYNSSIGMPRYTSQPINFTQPRDLFAEKLSKQELITSHQSHSQQHSPQLNGTTTHDDEEDINSNSEDDSSSIMVLGDNINNINDHFAFSPNTRSMYEDMGKSTVIQLQGSYRHQTLLDRAVRSSFSSNPYNSPANSRNQMTSSSSNLSPISSKRMTAEMSSQSFTQPHPERSTIASFEDLGHTRRGSVFGRIDSDDEDEDNPLNNNTASTNTGGDFASPRNHPPTDEDSFDQSHSNQSKGSRVRSIGHISELNKQKQVNRASFFDFIRRKPKKEFESSTNSLDESTSYSNNNNNTIGTTGQQTVSMSAGNFSNHHHHDIEKSKMDIISGESVSQLHEQLYGKKKKNESVFTKLKAKGIRPKDLKRIEGFKFKENVITQYELENPYRVISYYNNDFIWNGGQEIERCHRTRKVQPLYNNIDKMMYLIFEYEDFVLSKFGLPEPLFCKVSLYDIKSEVKLTEDFCFFIEPKHSLSSSDGFSMNKLANSTQRHIKNINKRQNFEKASALFVFEKPEHTEVYISFTIEKVFCGGLIEDAWKAYKSNNEKLMKKYLTQMNDYWRASMLRQPFIVMGQKIFYENRDENDNSSIEILEGQVKINKAYRIPSHSSSSFDVLTFLKWLSSNGSTNLPIQGSGGSDFSTTFNMDDDKNNLPIRFLFQTNTATRDKLASYLHAFSTRKSKASSQQSHTSMRFKNDFSMFKTDQDDHVIETVMKRLDKSKGSFSVLDTFYKLFPVVESLHNSKDYYQFDFNLRNTLYIYLDTCELSSLSKTGNIYIKVSYKKNDMITSTRESRMADSFNDSNRFNYFYSSITFKKISPQFYDEIRLEIPSSANIVDKSHVLFEFFDLDISKGLDGKAPQNSDMDISSDGITNTQLIGFAYLRDVTNHCIVKDGYHTLTIFKSPKLVDNYLSLQTDIPMSHSSYLNIKTKALTSFYTQDPFAASFLDACDRFYNTFESTKKNEDVNREEILLDVMSKLDNLRDANFAELLNHTPKVINGLLTLLSTLVIIKNFNQYGTRTKVIVPEIISRAMSCLLFFLSGIETVSSSFGRNNYYISTFISYFSRQYPDMEEPLYKMLMDEMLNFIQNWQESRQKDRKKPIIELGVFSPKVSDLNFKPQNGLAKNIDSHKQISTFLFTSMETRPNGKQAEGQVKEFKDFITRERRKVSNTSSTGSSSGGGSSSKQKQIVIDDFNTQKIIAEANPRKVSEISFTGVDVIKFGWFFFDLITKNIHIVRDEEFKKVSSQQFDPNIFMSRLKQLIHTIAPLLLECYEKRFKDAAIYAAATNFNLDFSLFLRDLVPILDFKYIREIMIEYFSYFQDKLSNDKTRDVAIFYILQFLELFIEHDDIFFIIQNSENQFIISKLIDCIIYGLTQKTDELKGLSLRILKNHLTKLDFDSRIQSQKDRNFIGNLYFDFVKKVIEQKDSISDCITFKDELGDLFACFYHILKNSSDEKIVEYFSSLESEKILSLVDILQVTVMLMNIHNQNQVQICFHEVYMELFNKIIVNLYLKPKSEIFSEKTNQLLSKFKDLLINHLLGGQGQGGFSDETCSMEMKQLIDELTISIYENDSQTLVFYEIFDKSLHFLLSVVLLSPYLDSEHKRVLFQSYLEPFLETFKPFIFINEHIKLNDININSNNNNNSNNTNNNNGGNNSDVNNSNESNIKLSTTTTKQFNIPTQLTAKIGMSHLTFDKTHLTQLLSDRNPKWKSILASVLSYCYFPTLTETFSSVRDVLYDLIEIYQHEQVDSIEDLIQKQQSHKEYLLKLGGTLHVNRDTPHLSVEELEKMNFSKLENLVEKLFINPNIYTNSLLLSSSNNQVSSPINNNTQSSNSNLQSNISNGSGGANVANNNNLDFKLTYAEIFFSSYLFFTTPHQLLLMIRQILFKFAQDPEIEHKSEMVLNITLSIKLWIEKHFTDMTQPFICNLIQFLDNDLTLVIKQVAFECFYLLEQVKSSLINCLLGIKEQSNEDSKKKPNPIIPNGFSKLKLNLLTSFVPSFDLLAWNSTEIARQLTLIDFEFFKQIDNKEICASTKQKDYLPHLSSLLERKRDCELWVVTLILRERDLNKRIEIINKFNQICEELFAMNNLFGLYSIYCGLSNHAILRLNKSWSKESKKIYRLYHETYFSDKNPQARENLINRLNSIKLPIIPLVNSYLDELKECDIEPTFRQSNGTIFINFGKCIKLVEILQHFKSYQEVGYNFESIPYLIKILCVDVPSDLIQTQSEALELSNQLESE